MSVNYGSDQSFTITPDGGYHVADVLVDRSSVGAVTSYLFPHVTADHTISAFFAADGITHTITASYGDNGSMLPSGAVVVNHGGHPDLHHQPGWWIQNGDVRYMWRHFIPRHILHNEFNNSRLHGNCNLHLIRPNFSASNGDNVQILMPVNDPPGGLITITFDQPRRNLSVVPTDCSGNANINFLGTCYDITFIGTYNGYIYVTIPYDDTGMSAYTESNLQIYHCTGGTCTSCTYSRDMGGNTVTGRVTSLSDFGIGFHFGLITGANTYMIAFLAFIAISTGVFLIKNQRRFMAVRMTDRRGDKR